VPHILVFAVQDIPAGTEVRYDYGGGGSLPWRKVEENQHYNVFFLPFVDLIHPWSIKQAD